MHGIGKLFKDGHEVIGLFQNDQYIRPVEANEIGNLSQYIL